MIIEEEEMSDDPLRGSCLCGEVTFELEEAFLFFHYCHCSRCRKTTGSAHSANIFVRRAHFRWVTGEDRVGRFELPAAEYFCTGFCARCGSNLPWVTRNQRYVLVPAGALDAVPTVLPGRNVFWASRAPWYESPAALPCLDEGP